MTHFTTLTGSTYHIDLANMNWSRNPSKHSGKLMGINAGPLSQVPEIIAGQRCLLVEGPMGLLETISTSPVISTWTD